MVALGASLGSGIDQFVLHSRDVVRVDFVALYSCRVELEVTVAVILRILYLLDGD